MPALNETMQSPVIPGTSVSESDTKNTGDPEAIVSHPAKSSWKHLFAFTKWSHAGTLATALAASAITAGLKTALTVVLGIIFNVIADYGMGESSGPDTLASISSWAVIIVGLGVGNWVANSAFLALWIIFGELQAASVRRIIFSSLLSSDMAWFDSHEQGVSSLVVRIQTQTRELQLATSQLFGLLICDTITALASLAVALYFSWKLTLVLLATLPVSALVLSLATRKLEPAIQAQRRDLATASKHATSSLTAIDLVNVFGGHGRDLRQYTQAIQRAARHYLVQALCNSVQMGYVAFWVMAMFVVGFWYGAVLVNQGLSPGGILTTFYATLTSFQGIEALMPHWLVLSKGMSAGAFLQAIVDSSTDGHQARKYGRSLRPASCVGDVELNNVSFSYPSTPEHKVLNPASFFFPAGDITFIVGRSGSGKSTIGNLIANFYDPLTGGVNIDGNSVRILDRDWIHENVTLIQQSSVLFNDSFFMNVALGHPNPHSVTHQDVLAASEACILESTISGLPRGVDTNVGPEGHDLSGGQKQRLALARAWLRDPPVLILDEITSGLDQVTRSLVMDTIRSWRKNKTTIIITHDTSQIGDDDFVYVMRDSFLAQEGYKRNLVKEEDGHFASLMAPSLDDTNVSIPDIHIIAPNTPQDASPDTPLIRTRSSRLADLFIGELENNALRATSPAFPRRASLGAGTNYSLRLQKDQAAWHPAEMSSRPSSFRLDIHNNLDEEMKRFSRFVTRHFWLEEDTQHPHKHLSQPTTSSVPSGRQRPGSGDSVYPQSTGEDRHSHREIPGNAFPVPLSRGPSPPSPCGDTLSPGDIEMSEVSERKPHGALKEMESRSSAPKDASLEDRDSSLDEDFPLDLPKRPKKKGSVFTTLATVWPTIEPRDRVTLIFGLAACIIDAASTPAFSYAFAQLLGVLTSPGDKLERGTKWVCVMLGLAIMGGLGRGGGRYMLERVGQSWVDTLRAEAYRRILLQPKPWFGRSKNSPGRISECLDRNAEEMRNIVGKFVPIIVSVAIMISMAVIWSFAVSWELTLVALSLLPVTVAAVKGFTLVSGRWEDRCNQRAEDASATLTEVCLNIRAVRALTLGDHFTARYHARVADALGTGYRRAIYSCGLYGLYQSVSYAMTSLVFYYGTVLLADRRELGVAQVMQVINLLLFSIGTATSILTSIPQLTMAQSTASQMLAYASMATEPPEGQQGHMVPRTPLPITLTNLRFAYPQRCRRGQVLNGTTLSIKPGTCTAIVGPSGCGKSTILSMLLGLHVPDNPPALEYCYTPSSQVDMRLLRSSMAYVPQSPFVFPASIADNITYGLPDDSPLRHSSQVCRATDAAGLHDWIVSLPDGYDTLVGDGGQGLSGGQAQRLSIARALVRRPKLLVLDEPTSALDVENAHAIRQAVRSITETASDVAVVLVTHSSEMMRSADSILMLGEGAVVVEEGTYDELRARRGDFAKLVGGT